MGYTHYFRQNKPASAEQWDAICKDFRELLTTALVTSAFPIQREEDDPSSPYVGEDMIAFNGAGPDAHETMVLVRDGSGFQCCKTARKPYDQTVIALLLFIHKHAPDVWEVSSDGIREEWQDVVSWLDKRGFHGLSIPERV